MRRIFLFLAVLLGFAFLYVVLILWTSVPEPDDVGEPPPVAPAETEPAAVPEPDHVEPPLREQPEPEPELGGDPVWLTIDAIGVDHPVIPVGLNDDGSMEIPHDVNDIGWYTPLEIRPGEDGHAVLAGHVDSAAQGPGALFDLRHLELDDSIVTLGDDGVERTWVVTARIRYPKDEAPMDEIFATEGPARLVIVTCGGEFDRTARSYEDNIVVYAEPA